MDATSGVRIHQLIAELADSRPTVHAIVDHVHESFRARPIGGTTVQSARLRCVTAVAVHFDEFAPSADWKLAGAEIDLGASVADLVWRHTSGIVAVDEIKSGRVRPGQGGSLDEQLGRLAAGGGKRWRSRFAVDDDSAERTALRHADHLRTSGTQAGRATSGCSRITRHMVVDERHELVVVRQFVGPVARGVCSAGFAGRVELREQRRPR